MVGNVVSPPLPHVYPAASERGIENAINKIYNTRNHIIENKKFYNQVADPVHRLLYLTQCVNCGVSGAGSIIGLQVNCFFNFDEIWREEIFSAVACVLLPVKDNRRSIFNRLP